MKKVLVAVVLMLLVNMGFSVISNAENPRSWGIQPNTVSKAWSSDATGLEE